MRVVAHGHYMVRVFSKAAVPALGVSGETASASREDALRALREREVNVVFAVDLFNEGLDLPDVRHRAAAPVPRRPAPT